MRIFYLPSAIITAMLLLTTMGCKKENVTNTPPVVQAGDDIVLELPASTTTLNGSASDAENNIKYQYWEKINGPSFCSIEDIYQSKTGIKDLKEGNYRFVLRVWDGLGGSGIDTVTVTVRDPVNYPNEMLFSGLTWNCAFFGGCGLGIANIYNRIPNNQPIKVYIKKVSSSDWMVAYSEPQGEVYRHFVYQITDGSLSVHSDGEENGLEVGDPVEIKIVW